ncbi:hypothetical protein [Pseudomonas azotoformans]|uniref:hypothetical protein n=1 Tax=Pseudomonas azotoformans TaxID=47878 RepID=UPI00122E6079|nr:hypothetical protein [Pseudomonas azotoformans]UMY50421.1 hypothetical protein MLC69_05060 [Pseudomonas azotoformans]
MFKQSENLICVKSILRSNGRVYDRTDVFDLDAIGIVQDAWIAIALKQMSSRSIHEKVTTSYTYGIQQALSELSVDIDAIEILNKNESALTAALLHRLFLTLERRLLKRTDKKAESRRKISFSFRNLVIHSTFNCPNEISRESINYKTILGALRADPRPILNSEQHAKAHSNKIPLGAVPHKNYNELISKSIDLLATDLQKIIDACIADLNNIEILRKLVISSEDSTRSASTEKVIRRFIYNSYPTSYDIRRYEILCPKKRLNAYLNIIKDDKLLYKGARLWVGYKLPELLKQAGLTSTPGFNTRHILALSVRACFIELQAIFILLLCRTGWNKASLFAMEINNIIYDEEYGHYEIQGYKSKTDDFTPSVFIDRHEKHSQDAIRRLIWNRNQLILLEFIPATEQRIWFSWTTSKDMYTERSVMIQMTPDAFIERHSLFKFTLEQIREQVGSLEHYTTRSTEHTRRKLGHTSIGTTGLYLDQLFSRNINSSINLEFQKRLEKKIIFNMEKIKTTGTLNLMPIGDGALCSDPINHPFKSLQSGENICQAHHCHIGDGCPNRVIEIDEFRITEVIRTRNYYYHHWKQLYSENNDHFSMRIAPRIIFNEALYNFINSSAYGYILRQIEATINHD